MDVTSVAQGVYNRYTDTLQKLKGGDISAEQALDFHGRMSWDARGMTASVARSMADATPVKNPSIDLLQQIHDLRSQAMPGPAMVTQAYARDGGWQGPPTLDAGDIIDRNFADAPSENEVRMFAEKIMEQTVQRMEDFLPHVPAMEAAGLTMDDLARALVTRSKDGTYRSDSDHDKSDAVARFVNSNSDVRALYDQQWARLTNEA